MDQKSIFRRGFRHFIILLALLIIIAAIAFGPAFLKFDHGKMFTREGWQLPDQVLESLGIQPGSHVADIGAGDGYFTLLLAEKVGPGGKVYAVDVDEDVTKQLRDKVKQKRYANVEVVLGKTDDPLLPDGKIDLAFLCNSYHHIENRMDYFNRLRTDLKENGRVAIIDLKDTPLVKLLAPADHWTTVNRIHREMIQANYREQGNMNFLPLQSFVIFSTLRQ